MTAAKKRAAAKKPAAKKPAAKKPAAKKPAAKKPPSRKGAIAKLPARKKRVPKKRVKDTRTRGQRVIDFIEQWVRVPEGDLAGQLMVLLPFQKRFILEVFDNPFQTRRAYLSIARKNGKTALIAALLLAFICGPEAIQNSQIISGAQSRKQAALVFSLASKMIKMTPELDARCRIVESQKRIIGIGQNVEYTAIAAESTTAHGLSPVLALLDEVGQIRGPTDSFTEAITTSQGAYSNPLLIAISTQAATDADLFSVWLDDAASDPQIISHVYTCSPDDDLESEETWRASNPALGIFRNIDDVRQQASAAARLPSQENGFRNLTLNQRVSMHASFITPKIWRENIGTVTGEAGIAYAGLDLSQVLDLTAFLMTVKVGDKWEWRPLFWAPEEGLDERVKRDRAPYDVWAKQGLLKLTPGTTVDYEIVARDVVAAVNDVTLITLGFDRWRMPMLVKELNRLEIELPLQEIGQGYVSMTPAIEATEKELVAGNIAHGDHPILKWCSSNAVVLIDPAGNRKLDKAKSTGRIDGIVCAVMAQGLASTAESTLTESFFEAW